jgi:transposase
VAIPVDRDEKPVRRFGCFTADLHAMAAWLKECDIETVAMESTGVYWIPVFQILESHGLEVKLVNARLTSASAVSIAYPKRPSAGILRF